MDTLGFIRDFVERNDLTEQEVIGLARHFLWLQIDKEFGDGKPGNRTEMVPALQFAHSEF